MTRRLAGSLFLAFAAAVLLLEIWPSPVAEAMPAEKDPSERNLAIVVNQSNPVENVSMKELRQIFLGERSHWPNGRRITLVMLPPGLERHTMLREVYHMTEGDLDQHFLHGLFTGDVFVSPKTLATPVGVCKFVFNVPGAIGYVRHRDADKSVKVIRVDGHLPGDDGYKLQIDVRPTG
jgi:hypothetical protein